MAYYNRCAVLVCIKWYRLYLVELKTCVLRESYGLGRPNVNLNFGVQRTSSQITLTEYHSHITLITVTLQRKNVNQPWPLPP